MSTTAQIDANRKNAELSTGPRTGDGKAVASRNSTKHGLSSDFIVLWHENADEFKELSYAFHEEFEPVGVHEGFLVRMMVEARWRQSRCGRLEAISIEMLMDPELASTPDGMIITRMSQGRADVSELLHRYATAALNQYHRCHRELQQGRKQQFKLEQERQAHYIKSVVFAPTPGQIELLAAGPNGFVSQDAPAAPKPSAASTLGNLALRL